MTPSPTRTLAAALLAALVALASTACSSATHGASHQSGPSPESTPSPERTPSPAVADQSEAAAIAQARADSVRHPYTQADIDFMSGMIGHHAQAILMAGWAPTHGASPSVQTLCARILNAQRDEIRTMQTWLRDRRQPVPQPMSDGMTVMVNGAPHMMMMPGMLTEAQLKQLDAAKGPEFDRLFLTFMIQHHRGAISMVKKLFGTNGAAQDELVFKLASDINVDQTTEVARMQRMLAAILFGSASETPPAGGRS
ncbi:MAG TPA: DUF305 domain-containing protein [Gemmatimonadaceae bacterium]